MAIYRNTTLQNETSDLLSLESFVVESLVWDVICGVICVPTVLGNVLILLCVINYNGVRSSIHTLIGNLAISDLLVSAVLFPFSIVTSVAGYNSNKYVCLTKASILILSVGGTCYGLLLVSVDRFIAICYPMQYLEAFSKRRLFFMLISGWTYVAFWACLPLSGWNFYDINLPYNCMMDQVYTPIYQKVMNSNFIFILFLNFVMYGIVIKIAVQKSRQIYAEERLFSFRRETRDFYKVKTMGIVQGLFLVCWLPYCVVSVTVSFGHDLTLSKLQSWSLSLGLMNSSLNWIVYGYRNKQLRLRMKAYLPWFKHENREIDS